MNGVLRVALVNPWLASLVSFLPIVALLACVVLVPAAAAAHHATASANALVGAARRPGRRLRGRGGPDVRRQGRRRRLRGLTITANFLMSLAIDKFGWFGMAVHDLNSGRMLGGALMVGGITLITRS